MAYGSGRSIPGLHLLNALTRSGELFDRLGGHAQAVGFTLPRDNIERLIQEFERHACSLRTGQNLEPVLRIDARVSLPGVGEEMYCRIKQLEPFGLGNPAPVFVSSVTVAGNPRVLKEKHLKICVQCPERSFEAVGWGLAGCAPHLARGQNVEVAFSLAENHFQGETSLRLMLKDVRC